jgi:predicted DNA-binding transcriptional regulator YafY
LTFTSEELEGLVLGASIAAAWGDPDRALAFNSAMTRIEAVLPAALRQVLIDTPLFAPELQSRAGMSREVATIRRAIGEHRVLSLHYARAISLAEFLNRVEGDDC